MNPEPTSPLPEPVCVPSGANAALPFSSPLSRRLPELGLARNAPSSMFSGKPLLALVPWWQLWQRDPRSHEIEGRAASVFPAVANNIVSLEPHATIGQSVFAALLPIHKPETAVNQLTQFAIGAVTAKHYPGPSPLLGSLKHLLENQPEREQTETWSRIVRFSFDQRGKSRGILGDHAIALIDTVGRTGLSSLAPVLANILENDNPELVLATIASLVRLGTPNSTMSAEIILSRVQPQCVESARSALTFAETGDLDILTELFATSCCFLRLQILRLVESILTRSTLAFSREPAWLLTLATLLLRQLKDSKPSHFAGFIAAPLGLTLRHCGEPGIAAALATAPDLKKNDRIEAFLNALLIAEPPPSSTPRIEELRRFIKANDVTSLRALNRVLMSLGTPSGSAQDWFHTSVVIYLQMGILRLPEPILSWFEDPSKCPQEFVVSWLLDRPFAGLAVSFCAAHLIAKPDFVNVLERIWIDAATARNENLLLSVGALLAGAAQDSAISPTELRCCLGTNIGGPLPETPEMLGQLLGLVMTQTGTIANCAENLLLHTSPASQTMAGHCLHAIRRSNLPFGSPEEGTLNFGTPTTHQTFPLPDPMHPLFEEVAPAGSTTAQLLGALALPCTRSKDWLRQCLDWKMPARIESAFAEASSEALATGFVQASASPHSASRELAAQLVIGVGPRILESPLRDLVLQRLAFLAVHDPAPNVSRAGQRASEVLGQRNSATTLEPPSPVETPVGTRDPGDDLAFDMLCRGLQSILRD